LDVTLHSTYEMVRDIFKEIFLLFPDPLVHLGGDEVSLACLANATDFVKLENITPDQIEPHYRKKQKKILKELNSTKKFIYWTNEYSLTT
jgi:N-acetyl-beta-hexosaminidase